MTSKYWEHGFPKTVCELGPGQSLGCGICAVLSGVERYIALDAKHFSTTHLDHHMVEGIYNLFLNNSPIPGDDMFPKVNPKLVDYDFPLSILDNLNREKIDTQKLKLESSIQYVAPMTNTNTVPSGSVDFLFSQAVLEHVTDINDIYMNCNRILRTGGIMSHTIDFKSHGKSTEWNGHWRYPNWLWKVIVGRRPFLINREPVSSHLKAIERNGFDVVQSLTVKTENRLSRQDLAEEYKDLCDDDLGTSGVFLVARKR